MSCLEAAHRISGETNHLFPVPDTAIGEILLKRCALDPRLAADLSSTDSRQHATTLQKNLNRSSPGPFLQFNICLVLVEEIS